MTEDCPRHGWVAWFDQDPCPAPCGAQHPRCLDCDRPVNSVCLNRSDPEYRVQTQYVVEIMEDDRWRQIGRRCPTLSEAKQDRDAFRARRWQHRFRIMEQAEKWTVAESDDDDLVTVTIPERLHSALLQCLNFLDGTAFGAEVQTAFACPVTAYETRPVGAKRLVLRGRRVAVTCILRSVRDLVDSGVIKLEELPVGPRALNQFCRQELKPVQPVVRWKKKET